MTNDARRRLEDAIIAYGAAKALHACTEPEMRHLAANALTEAWDRVAQLLNEVTPEIILASD